MSSAERAWRFDAAVQERAARRVQHFELGAALYADDLPRVYDANFVRLDRGVEDLDAAAFERLADSLQNGLAHRKLLLRASPEADALVADLRPRGWSATRTLVMEYDGPRRRSADAAAAAEQVDTRAVRGARDDALEGRGDDVRAQVADYTERLATATGARTFAAFANGEVASFCVLLEADGIGEIDEVTTVTRHRRRGLGKAVVEAALAASLAAGNDLTFLVAAADDWPKEWYARMGFRVVGERWEVYRT
jgi:ribosomal protein S18 acetylase RimI-like enzyme